MTEQDFGKVAVLLGGHSAEREISLQSGQAVLEALRHCGVDAHPFDPGKKQLAALLDEKFDRAHIALHGRFGEDGTVQGALELMGIPYTGSGVMASALAMDKWRTKLIWQAVGVNSPLSLLINEQSDFERVVEKLGLPLIIKPAREGSTIGLSKINQAQDIEQAYRLAAEHDSLVLAEAFIEGVELTAAILGETALPLVKIAVAGELYDYEAKYLSDDTRYFCPCGLPEDQERLIQIQALKAYQTLGCEGWGRIDLILSQDGQFYFLEANTSPGMTSHSLVPMAARTAGIGFEDLVLKILSLSHVG